MYSAVLCIFVFVFVKLEDKLLLRKTGYKHMWAAVVPCSHRSCLTPDSVAHLHNITLRMLTSNARHRYWLPNNPASNKNAVCLEDSRGIDLKNTHTEAVAAAAGCYTVELFPGGEICLCFLCCWQVKDWIRRLEVFSIKEDFISFTNTTILGNYRSYLTHLTYISSMFMV